MTIETNVNNGILLIYPKVKQLDSSVSMKFREYVKTKIDEGNRNIIINLNNIDFIDSSGLGALVLGHKEMREKGRMLIVSSKDKINNLLKLVRLDQVLSIYSDENEAIHTLHNN